MLNPRFRHFLAIDWSGAVGERHAGIALGLCHAGDEAPCLLRPADHRHWSREAVLRYLMEDLPPDTLVGLDLGMALPFADAGAFFPGWSDSPASAHELWRLVDEICAADAHLSASSFVDHLDLSAYFRRHGGREGDRFHAADALHRRGRFRRTEVAQERMGCRPYSNFNLVGAAQVGKSSLTGMRLLHRLRRSTFVWPFDGLDLPEGGSVIVEIYTTIAAMAAGRGAGRSKIRDGSALDKALHNLGSRAAHLDGAIDDHRADALITAAWLRLHASNPALWRPRELDETIARTEGWTFGAA